jgi:pectinesterase
MLRPVLLVLSGALAATAPAQDVHVNVTPGQGNAESTTQYPTIQMAMDHAPEPGPGPGKDGRPARLFLHISPGTYHERVIVTENRPNTTFLGSGTGPSDVVISAAMNAKMAGGTFFTETVRVDAPGFEADNLTFENTAGNTGQAVALALRSDRSVIKHCRILGHQDTLFADFGRQYFLDDYIEGTVDFIFGNAAAVFDRSEIHELSPGYLTAQSRTTSRQATGYVIARSRVTSSLGDPADVANRPAADQPGAASTAAARNHFFLGRPWRAYSRAVVMETELPGTLSPEGWSKWAHNTNDQTAFYAEYKNTGPGASPATRPAWTHQLTDAEARQYRPEVFLAGPASGPEHWDPIAEAARLP